MLLDEALLANAVARPQLMADQIAHLRQAAAAGLVVIRVLPLITGREVPGHHICELTLPARPSQPTVLSMAESPAVGARYTSETHRVQALGSLLDELEHLSYDPARSLECLAATETALRICVLP